MRHTGITGYGGVLALKKFINIIAVCGNTARKAIKEAFGHFTTTATVVIKLIGNLNIGILIPQMYFLRYSILPMERFTTFTCSVVSSQKRKRSSLRRRVRKEESSLHNSSI